MKLIHILTLGTVVGLSCGAAASLQEDIRSKIMAEAEQYKAAVIQFQDRYGALPGDMKHATDIWGIAKGETGSDAICYGIDSRALDDPKRTCNGNGDGRVYHKDGVSDQTAPEWFRAWQHLANAELIDGAFSGKADLPPRGASAGVNVPQSAFVEYAGYTLLSLKQLDHPAWFPGDYLGLAFGRSYLAPSRIYVETRAGAISAADADALDNKFDDGNPRGGLIRSFRDLTQCIARPAPGEPYAYLTESDIKGCGLFFALHDPGYADAPLLQSPY